MNDSLPQLEAQRTICSASLRPSVISGAGPSPRLPASVANQLPLRQTRRPRAWSQFPTDAAGGGQDHHGNL